MTPIEQLQEDNLLLHAQINALIEMQRERLRGAGWSIKEIDSWYQEKVQAHLHKLKTP